ncbi:MAG: aldo/keto reductase [Kiritimatiellae bacterium]|nr:aldo/keto reductase [Kiritimatiellia bacterium]
MAFDGCAAAAKPGAPRGDPFERVALGVTGIVTTRLGFGTGINGWNRSSAIVRNHGAGGAAKIIRGAYDRGVRFFDAADAYGTHAALRDGLKGVPRGGYVLATKCALYGGVPADDLKQGAGEAVDRFLRELGTDYIDIVQLHCLTDAAWPRKLEAQMEALEKAKKAGKIRAHGCSFHSLPALKAAAATPWLDVAHVRINPFGRNMDGKPEEVMPVLKRLHSQGRGVIGMKILGEGAFAKDPAKVARSIAYAVDSGAVDVLNVGFASLAELDEMISRMRGRGAAAAG